MDVNIETLICISISILHADREQLPDKRLPSLVASAFYLHYEDYLYEVDL